MRLHPALAVAAVLLPALAAAQTDEWVRDDMSDESLWLLRTGNLAREAPRAGTLPGAPDGGSHWVMSKGDGPAYVVYFLPGPIHEVEIDTHRLAGAAGDFTLAVSTDGKLYQPLDAGAVLLDTSFGWDYRLMASDQIPENATHLLVQFPDGSTAHSLSEVWIRYTWDDALVSRFLPETVAPTHRQETHDARSDAELQAMLETLLAQAAEPPAREVFPPVGQTPAPPPPAFVTEPLRAPHTVEVVAPSLFVSVNAGEGATTPVVLEDEPARSTGPAAEASGAVVNEPEAAPVDSGALALAVQSGPAPAHVLHTAPLDAEAQAPAPAEDSEIQIDPDQEITAVPEETPGQVAAPAPGTTAIDVAVFETPAESAPPVSVQPLVLENAGATPEPASAAMTIDVPNFATTIESRQPTPEGTPVPVDAEHAAEVSEGAIVLPTFTLPVFVSSEPGEQQAPLQFEAAPQATADPVVFETAALAAGEPPPPVSVQAALASDNVETRIDASLADPVSHEPAQPVEPDPAPTPVAPRIDPVAAEQSPEVDADDESGSDSKPTLRMKRTGPRSKSRATYVARG